MGQRDGVRFCDACGRPLAADERLVQCGAAWVCPECAAPEVPLALDRPPPRRVKAWSRLGVAGIALGLAGGGLAFLDASAGMTVAGLGALLSLIGLILALATGRESAHAPAMGLVISIMVLAVTNASVENAELLRQSRAEREQSERQGREWMHRMIDQP